MEDRMATFENSADPFNARPTPETYGLGSRPLNVGLSSVTSMINEHRLTFDVDGVFGHCRADSAHEVITASSLMLVKSGTLGYIKRSKYNMPYDGEGLELKKLQSLKIAELPASVLGTFDVYLVWARYHPNLVLVRFLNHYS